MESNKQERANLVGINYLSKHMSTPLNMGGSKSGMYMNDMAPKMEKGSAVYMKDEDFKGKKPDANGNGVPDYAEDGKGKS